jgi:methyltransferase (TIGR00027 family)
MSRATISHVSDTAMWVAFYRALESERPDALFRDRFARGLSGAKGEEIARAMQGGVAGGWPIVVRTKLMDGVIEGAAASGEIDTVLNLAAGLDARPWRLTLPKELLWIEVDLPAMIAHKRAVIGDEPPACTVESVALDLSDVPARRALFERVGIPGRRVLVVTEGLLIYLTPEAVAALSDDLARAPGIAQWMLDLASPALLRMMAKSWGKTVAAGGAPFLFAPEAGVRFFEPHGFRETLFLSIWEGALRLNRKPPMAWLWRIAGFFAPPGRKDEIKRFSGVVLLRRTQP